VPGRHADAGDFLADTAGAAAAGMIRAALAAGTRPQPGRG
jgi:hypothetical protein